MGTGASSALKRRDAADAAAGPKHPSADAGAGSSSSTCPAPNNGHHNDVDVTASGTRIKCSKCGSISSIPCGTSVYGCHACGAQVHVALPSVSQMTHKRAKASVLAAQSEIATVLTQQETLTSTLWDTLGDELSMQEAMWQSGGAEGEANHACTLLAEAFAAHDASQVLEALAYAQSMGLSYPDSLRTLIVRLQREEDLEVVWRCLATAVANVDRVELEFWAEEAAHQGLLVPGDIEAMVTALRDEECARLAEMEHQASFDERVRVAHFNGDHACLKKLTSEAKMHDLNGSMAEAALTALLADESQAGGEGAKSSDATQMPRAPSKSAKATSTAEAQPQSPATPPSHAQNAPGQHSQQLPTGPSIAELKKELQELGVSCEGVVEKADLIRLLNHARSQRATPEATSAGNSGTRSTTSSSFPRGRAAPDASQFGTSSASAGPSPGPRIPRAGSKDGTASRGQEPRQPSNAPSSSPPKRQTSHSDPQNPPKGYHNRRTPPGDAPPSSSAQTGPTPSGTKWSSSGAHPRNTSGKSSAHAPASSKGSAERAQALACLGLEGDPDAEEIRKAYKRAALRWHPDRRQNHTRPEEAKQKFQEVRAAYETLEAALP